MAGRKSARDPEAPWIKRRCKMLSSPAWRVTPLPVRKILDRLEIEHMRHAGTANGQLSVSFGQFAKEGVARKDIVRALDLATRSESTYLRFLEITPKEVSSGELGLALW